MSHIEMSVTTFPISVTQEDELASPQHTQDQWADTEDMECKSYHLCEW